ncbi:hypothetical protein BDZ97DRAFT_1901904 [Flammula alnicola]|nr:hypothetical protein BDZ97DRAFT_1901904 [Flammula alnicola]
MSRALGAAFLSHQVEQLEKTVSSNGPASGNWRDRKNPTNGYGSPGSGKRGPNSPGGKVPLRKKGDGSVATTKERATPKDKDFDRGIAANPGLRRRSAEEERKGRDADVVVVDASVLIYALYQVKKWCREGREEIVIVPLEALNTLDLLKKGTTSLAQKARAASRILEAQVGTNPRIRVQRDDAFVLWDKISFEDQGAAEPDSTKQGASPNSCPEWVRRIICCARWETENPEEELKPLKVVLAILSVPPNMSPQSVSLKLADMSITTETPLTPRMMEEDRPKRSHAQNTRGRRTSASDHGPRSGLVERPPAVMAMMEMISQPSKVVRVLARGEKLDPDP